jgi:hypothetical protein
MFEPTVEELILEGIVEVSGIDSESGQFLYSFTDKVKQVLPEMLEKRLKNIHSKILFFWRMGFIDIDDPRSSNPVVMLSDKAFDEDAVDQLPEDKRVDLEEIKRLFER